MVFLLVKPMHVGRVPYDYVHLRQLLAVTKHFGRVEYEKLCMMQQDRRVLMVRNILNNQTKIKYLNAPTQTGSV